MSAPASSLTWRASRVGRSVAGADPDREAARRLGTFYAVLAALFAMTIPLRAVAVSLSDIPLPGVWTGNGVGVFAALAGAAMFWITRRSRMPAARMVEIGLWLEVVLCLALSLSEQILVPVDRFPPRLPFATVLIMTFPVIAPGTLKRRRITTFLCASTVPAATLILWSVGLTTANPRFAPFGWIVGYLAAGLALATSRIVHRLAQDAARARQLGSYQLERKIGGGGMGEVWEASHHMLARPAAIKLIRSKATGEEKVQAQLRFEREAQATSALRSPHTVQLYDFGITPNGTLYYAMELLDGLDLEQIVERFGPLRAPRATYVLKQICRSLSEAHEAGLLHRDIKPANIFLCRLGSEYDHVKVLDFGLVRARVGGNETKLSAAHVATGTPATMAPEMAVGSDDIDARADLYSLGCVGYWLLTGQLVFEEKTAMKMLMAHVQKKPDAPSSRSELPIPAELDALILACLAKEPTDRPASADELYERLDRLSFDSPWNEARARTWWHEHLPELSRPRTRAGEANDEEADRPEAREELLEEHGDR